MFEVLDVAEQLLAQSPYLGANPRYTLMHMEAASTSKYNHTPGSDHARCLYNDQLDFFLFEGAQSAYPRYRFVPENYLAATAAVAQDTTLVVHNLTIEPSSGRVWGVVNNSSGNDGLYRRDPSVTSPNWTKVIGASNGATLRIYIKPNGDIWYNDATAGNWYLLANGAAGSAQASPPSGLYTSAYAGALGSLWNPDFIAGPATTSILSFYSSYNSGALLTNGGFNAETFASGAGVYDTSAAPAAGNFKCLVPIDFILAARFVALEDLTGFYTKTIRLNSTYSLIVAGSNAVDNLRPYYNGTTNYARYSTEEPARSKVALALLNKSSWTCKYLGTISVPWINEAVGSFPAAAETALAPFVLGARMKNSSLDLVITGTLANAAGTTQAGLMLGQVPITKLDF
jgi:hypothetical protein